MPVKRIPAYGEAFLGNDPYAVRMMKVVVGYDSDSVDVAISVTNTSGTELINLSAGVFIYDVAWQLTSAFSAAVDITIGLDSDLDAFALVTDIDATESVYNLRTMRTLYLPEVSGATPSLAPALYAGYMSVGSSQSICCHLAVSSVESQGEFELYVMYCYMPKVT